MKPGWSAADIPDLTGRTAVVTGASGGIGYEIAVMLAARGAHVVLASRGADRATEAEALISQRAPGASTESRTLDLASLESVRQFAEWFGERHGRLDILVNNAGVAGGPRRETAEGFEMHFGVNHLGHFALTGLLFPWLGLRSRVVTMSTGLAAQARIDFSDLQGERRYRMTAAYGQSKLAQLMFAFEFDRRLRSSGTGVASFATHPGVARTRLITGRRTEWGRGPGIAERAVRLTQLLFGAEPARAALPGLYQATDPAADSSVYVGTSGHMRGHPAACKVPPAAADQDAAGRLWDISSELTGISYDLSRLRGSAG
jgi:NAD(P)-dependent dehydrogenase (short-subunit alcohol dehydrogenase family)